MCRQWRLLHCNLVKFVHILQCRRYCTGKYSYRTEKRDTPVTSIEKAWCQLSLRVQLFAEIQYWDSKCNFLSFWIWLSFRVRKFFDLGRLGWKGKLFQYFLCFLFSHLTMHCRSNHRGHHQDTFIIKSWGSVSVVSQLNWSIINVEIFAKSEFHYLTYLWA